MTINVETGKIDKECKLNHGYWCVGCSSYFDEEDTVCKRGCKYYLKNYDTRRNRMEI
jgi:predicted nucleic acid-binding Zn ribbon protein